MNKVHIDNLRNTHLGILLEGVDLKNSIKSNNQEISDLKRRSETLMSLYKLEISSGIVLLFSCRFTFLVILERLRPRSVLN